jgi:hypothetical protein
VEENKALMDNVAEKYDLFTDVLKLRAAWNKFKHVAVWVQEKYPWPTPDEPQKKEKKKVRLERKKVSLDKKLLMLRGMNKRMY